MGTFPRISIIVAVSANGVIGANGAIPWHLSSDLRRFKQITSGHAIVMGRRTFESLGRILPNRRHIVLSRDPQFRPAGVHVAGSWQDALALTVEDNEVFVIGGEDIYRIALPNVSRIYLTYLPVDFSGDARFPLDQIADWQVVSEQYVAGGPGDQCDYWFRVLERPATTSDAGGLPAI